MPKHQAPSTKNGKQRTVKVRVHAPQFIKVRVPAGLSDRATLELATAKAQQQILLFATLA